MRRLLIASTAALCTTAGATSAMAAEWTQMRHDAAQSGVNGDEVAVGVANVGTGSMDWERRPPKRTAFLTAPILTDDAVVVGGYKTLLDGSRRSMLWSYDLDSGFLNWKRMLACQSVKAPSLALGYGMVVAIQEGCPWVDDDGGGLGQGVTLVDVENGRVRKTVRFEDRVDAPAVYGHTVVVDTSLDGDTVELINLETRRRSGASRSMKASPPPGTCSPSSCTRARSTLPATRDGIAGGLREHRLGNERPCNRLSARWGQHPRLLSLRDRLPVRLRQRHP